MSQRGSHGPKGPSIYDIVPLGLQGLKFESFIHVMFGPPGTRMGAS